ncbi:MAG: hypothetical protein AAGF57_04005 [Pseudomonadota bacterium]
MKPPWLGPSRDDVELESLQTDVMRFIAILGLCLAAIFSLVHSASQQPFTERQNDRKEIAVTESSPAPPQQVDRSLTADRETMTIPNPSKEQRPRELDNVAVSPHARETESAPHQEIPTVEPEVPPSVAQPSQAAANPDPGFSLEFESAQALDSLLRAQRIRLYARQADRFWSVDPNGRAVPVASPSQYYQMQSDTVPTQIQTALAAILADRDISWGVALPVAITQQIQALTASQTHGELLITADAKVVFAAP